MDDDNVVLQAENVLYKVFRSVLCRESPVFCGMFSIPQPQTTGAEAYDGCPLVRVPDSAEEFGLLLRVVFDANALDEECGNRDHILLLSIAAKYQAPRVLRRVLVLLDYHCPDTLNGYDHWIAEAEDTYDCPAVSRLNDTASLSSEDTFLLLKVAYKCGLHVLLPAQYYVATVNSIQDILAHAERIELPAECLHAILTGQHQLNDLARTEVFEPLFGSGRDISMDCRSPIKCHGSRHLVIQGDILYLGTNICPPLELLDDANGPISHCRHLCPPCKDVVMDTYRRGRSKVWDILPSVFGLPDWKNLRKARTELLGEFP